MITKYEVQIKFNDVTCSLSYAILFYLRTAFWYSYALKNTMQRDVRQWAI
jgi:hypothetical protein